MRAAQHLYASIVLPNQPPKKKFSIQKDSTRAYRKRRRMANTNRRREENNWNENNKKSVPQFTPADALGTKKRKLASVDGMIPGPRSGGFGIDDSYLDIDNEVEGIEDSQLAGNAGFATTKSLLPQTPLRSALRTQWHYGYNWPVWKIRQNKPCHIHQTRFWPIRSRRGISRQYVRRCVR